MNQPKNLIPKYANSRLKKRTFFLRIVLSYELILHKIGLDPAVPVNIIPRSQVSGSSINVDPNPRDTEDTEETGTDKLVKENESECKKIVIKRSERSQEHDLGSIASATGENKHVRENSGLSSSSIPLGSEISPGSDTGNPRFKTSGMLTGSDISPESDTGNPRFKTSSIPFRPDIPPGSDTGDPKLKTSGVPPRSERGNSQVRGHSLINDPEKLAVDRNSLLRISHMDRRLETQLTEPTSQDKPLNIQVSALLKNLIRPTCRGFESIEDPVRRNLGIQSATYSLGHLAQQDRWSACVLPYASMPDGSFFVLLGFEGDWCAFGGQHEPGELPEDTASREYSEETLGLVFPRREDLRDDLFDHRYTAKIVTCLNEGADEKHERNYLTTYLKEIPWCPEIEVTFAQTYAKLKRLTDAAERLIHKLKFYYLQSLVDTSFSSPLPGAKPGFSQWSCVYDKQLRVSSAEQSYSLIFDKYYWEIYQDYLTYQRLFIALDNSTRVNPYLTKKYWYQGLEGEFYPMFYIYAVDRKHLEKSELKWFHIDKIRRLFARSQKSEFRLNFLPVLYFAQEILKT